MSDVTVHVGVGAGIDTITMSQNAANVLMGMAELYEMGLISADEDVTGHASYEDEVVVECPSAITFKGRVVALALNEAKDAQSTTG